MAGGDGSAAEKVANQVFEAYAEGLGSASEKILSIYMPDAMLSYNGVNASGDDLPAFWESQFKDGPINLIPSARGFGGVDISDMGGVLGWITGEVEQGREKIRAEDVMTIFPDDDGNPVVRNHVFRPSAGGGGVNDTMESGFAEDLVTHYYDVYDGNVEGKRAEALEPFYSKDSVFVIEGEEHRGESILEKLASLPATKHELATLDVQPIDDTHALIVVRGHITMGGEDHSLSFIQTFVVLATGDDAEPYHFVVDLFAFNYG